MQYRTFGKLDWKPSALGFGCMRLPIIDGIASKVNQNEATRILRYAIDHGVNYVDTAYLYHEEASEPAVGRALRDGYRERVHLATKLPILLVKSPADFDRLLDEQLRRLQTDHIDMYLLHGLNKDRWPMVKEHDLFARAEKALADGRIRHLGFSFHDHLGLFKEIIDAFDHWTFCQIQYNYLDVEFQAGTAGLRYAASKGLGVVVMEPLRGGVLANPPAPIQAMWDSAEHKRSPAEWGLQWVWNHPEVSVVLSGMSTMQQVQENVASAERSGAESLTPAELELVARVRSAYRSLRPVPCTGCRYCQPCPNGVAIPNIFEIFNSAVMVNEQDHGRFLYSLLPAADHADNCVECGECEEQCPQQLPIRDWLKKAHAYLSLR